MLPIVHTTLSNESKDRKGTEVHIHEKLFCGLSALQAGYAALSSSPGPLSPLRRRISRSSLIDYRGRRKI